MSVTTNAEVHWECRYRYTLSMPQMPTTCNQSTRVFITHIPTWHKPIRQGNLL